MLNDPLYCSVAASVGASWHVFSCSLGQFSERGSWTSDAEPEHYDGPAGRDSTHAAGHVPLVFHVCFHKMSVGFATSCRLVLASAFRPLSQMSCDYGQVATVAES